MKDYIEHQCYEANVAYAQKTSDSLDPEGFLKCKLTKSEAGNCYSCVILSFQPPRSWLAGNYGMPVRLDMNADLFQRDIIHGLRTLRAKALEILAYQKKYHPDRIEKSLKKDKPQEENDTWN